VQTENVNWQCDFRARHLNQLSRPGVLSTQLKLTINT